MPFPMKIQPVDSFYDFDARQKEHQPIRNDSAKPMLKSRIKRLFDRQFPSVLKISSVSEKLTICSGELQQCSNHTSKDGGLVSEFEPSSVCLAKMVQNFIEESNDHKPSVAVKCGRRRCNCFNSNNNEISDDEYDVFGSSNDLIHSGSTADITENVKSLIPCTSSIEKNLLADTSKITESNKIHKRKDELRKIVRDELSALGYNASICKSRWDKSPSYPAGEYEYIDVTFGEERILIDIDFRLEFEIARSTSNYKSLLQHLPSTFVGKSDRLKQIVTNMSEAAKLSLTKKGMDLPPWRKAEYMIAKWLSPYTRTSPPHISLSSLSSSSSVSLSLSSNHTDNTIKTIKTVNSPVSDDIDECGEFELIFGEIQPSLATKTSVSPPRNSGTPVLLSPWQPPAIRPRSCDRGARVVTGLASLLKENSEDKKF